MNAQWHGAQNTFESNTRRSYAKANRIGMFTNMALSGVVGPPTDPLMRLRDYYRPRYAAFKAAYDAWEAMGSRKQGATLGLHDVESLIDHDVADWEFAVQGTYRKGTPGYKILFPDGISALKYGSREQRITRLTALSNNLALTPTLAEVKKLVDHRLDQLTSASEGQGSKISEVKADSSSVEAARLSLCSALFYVQGGLMQVFAETPVAIEAYIDVETLRKTPQSIFTGAVHTGPNDTLIVKRTLVEQTAITLTNDGPTALTFYFSTQRAGGLPAGGAMTVEPGKSVYTSAGEMDADRSARYMFVHDRDGIVGGHYTVVI